MSNESAVRQNRRLEPRRRAKNCTKAACRKGTLDLGKSSALALLDIGDEQVDHRFGCLEKRINANCAGKIMPDPLVTGHVSLVASS